MSSPALTLRLLWVATAWARILLGNIPANAALSTVTIFSPSNNRNVSFQLYTPPGYTEDLSRTYPVVISLHGIGGNSQQRANLYAPTLDARITAAEILPMIWLFPDGQTNAFYGDAFDGHKQVYSHMIGEALPYVDAQFRTIPDREHRAMEGFSMGGFGAAMYTAKHHELFSAVVEYGGALATWQNLVQFNNAVAVEMYNAVEANFLPYSLWDITTANAAALRSGVNYKMIVGDADSQYQSNVRFRDHLQSLGIDPHFQVLPGVEHVGGAYLSEGSGVRFLSEHFASVFRREGDYDRDGDVGTSDYGAWKAAFGSMSQLAADGNEDGVVDAADYVVWRHAISDNAGSSSLADRTVPEPATFVLLMMAAAGACARRRGASGDTRRKSTLATHDYEAVLISSCILIAH
jgi:enterochelin esterase-like enzyme